jgi:hypothetical protein
LLVQAMRLAFSFAFDSAGSSIAARIAMIAMTTSSSINVNPRRKFFVMPQCWQKLFLPAPAGLLKCVGRLLPVGCELLLVICGTRHLPAAKKLAHCRRA